MEGKHSIPVKGLAHIGVPCRNLSKSLEFYEALGFTTAAKKENLNGYDVAMVENGGCVVELFQALDPQTNQGYASRVDGHVDHMALCCGPDLDACYEQVQQRGWPVVSQGIETTLIWGEPCRYFITVGPDGERVELSER